MSRSWPYLTAVAAVGVLAGAAIGGKPVAQDPFVLSPEQIPTSTLVSTDVTVSVPRPVTTVAAPSPVTTTSTADGSTETATPDTASTTTVATATRVVIADATGTDTALVAARSALATAGYAQVAATVVAIAEATSTIYYRSGFVAQAAAVSAALGIVRAPLVLLVDQVVSTADDQGDVVVLLGSDVSS